MIEAGDSRQYLESHLNVSYLQLAIIECKSRVDGRHFEFAWLFGAWKSQPFKASRSANSSGVSEQLAAAFSF